MKIEPSDDANRSSGSGMENTGGTRRIRDGSMRCEGSAGDDGEVKPRD